MEDPGGTQEVGCGWEVIVVVLLALFVDFRWSVEISWKMGLLEEQDGAVVSVFPSGPLSILDAHFRL